MIRIRLFLLATLMLTACGTPSVAPLPTEQVALWDSLIITELTAFAVLEGLDSDNTGEVLLVGVLHDALGNHLMCTDDHAREPNYTTAPEHIPVKVVLGQPAGLRCNEAGRYTAEAGMSLTVAVFEVDDITIVSNIVEYVLAALEIVENIPGGDKVLNGLPHIDKGQFVIGLINTAIEESGLLRSVALIDVYYTEIHPSVDFTSTGDESANKRLRLYYHTSSLLNPKMLPSTAEPLAVISTVEVNPLPSVPPTSLVIKTVRTPPALTASPTPYEPRGCSSEDKSFKYRTLFWQESNALNGSDVEMLQRRLIELGYSLPQYGSDGWFGAETDAAVRTFQARNGLESDGYVGPIT